MTLSARAEATTRRTYNRPLDPAGAKFETWADTVKRSHSDHHRRLWEDAGGRPDERELAELDDLGSSRAGLVAGRTLWLGGTEYAYSRPCSQFNCSALELSTVYDMVDAFWLLLNGCGVGGLPRAGTLHGYASPIKNLEVVPSTNGPDHKGPKENAEEQPTDGNGRRWTIRFGDSAEAWARGLGKMLLSPRAPADTLVLDFSAVRGPGGRLRGYGWICNGYKPLADALTGVHTILNRCAGDLVHDDDIGDVFNWCGTVLSSRRAAEALCMDAHNPAAAGFARRKFEYWNGNNHRRQSNNSIMFWERPAVRHLEELLESNLDGGDPGFVNALAALRKCPWFRLFNPCLTGDTLVAVADGRNAVPIAQLAEESGGVNRFDVYSARPAVRKGRYGTAWVTEVTSAVAIMTGVKPVGRLTLSDGSSVRLTADHRVALANGTYLPASQTVGKEVEPFFTKDDKGRRLINSTSNGYQKQHRMMWERANGPKPDGYEIDHIDSAGGDFLDNLQLLATEEHLEKTAAERRGENNPIHRVRDREAWRRNRSRATAGAANPRHSGLTDGYLIELATVLVRDGIKVNHSNLRALDPRVPQSFSKNRFGGSMETLQKIARGETEYTPPVPPPTDPEPEPEPARPPLTVMSFTPEKDEPVYDLIVEKNRNFYVITGGDPDNDYRDSTGLLVHNCFEIMLPPKGFCNLVSVCLPSFGRDFRALERAVRVMARANYRQTCVDLRDGLLQPAWHQTNEALRLCGVSFTGIVQADWLSEYQIRRLRNAAVTGAYSMADELRLPRPKAVTTVKPEGTRSKITTWGPGGSETAEGMHRPMGRYVFNWINFSVHDPLVEALDAAGYRVIPNPSDPNNVLVRFPVEYSGCGFTLDRRGAEVNLESAVDQFDRYLLWNNLWADHNVSATISFDRDEIKDLARKIHDNWDNGYVATAFLARTDPTKSAADLGHPYLPQEVVTAADFRAAADPLRPVDWDRFHTGVFDLDEVGCVNGVCPVK